MALLLSTATILLDIVPLLFYTMCTQALSDDSVMFGKNVGNESGTRRKDKTVVKGEMAQI